MLDHKHDEVHAIHILDRNVNKAVNGCGGSSSNNSESRFWNSFAKYLIDVDALRKDMDCPPPDCDVNGTNNLDGLQGCLLADVTPGLLLGRGEGLGST